MVPGSYDQGKKTEAGGHKTERSGDRTGGCKEFPEQPQSVYRLTGQAEGKTDLAE